MPRSRFSVVICALFLFAYAGKGQAPLDKATPAWVLTWDADWVTAVSFIGNNKLAAGNNLGDILVWDLPAKPGDPVPSLARRLMGHTNTITRLTSAEQRWLLSASNDHTADRPVRPPPAARE